MTMQGLGRLMRHGEAWCEDRYYLGLSIVEVLRGNLLEEGGLFSFAGGFSKWRKALVQLGAEFKKKGKSWVSGSRGTVIE